MSVICFIERLGISAFSICPFTPLVYNKTYQWQSWLHWFFILNMSVCLIYLEPSFNVLFHNTIQVWRLLYWYLQMLYTLLITGQFPFLRVTFLESFRVICISTGYCGQATSPSDRSIKFVLRNYWQLWNKLLKRKTQVMSSFLYTRLP